MRLSCGVGLFIPENHAALGEVVGRHFNAHAVADQDADAVFAHLAAGVSQDAVAVFQLHAKHRVGQEFQHLAVKFDKVFFGHERWF